MSSFHPHLLGWASELVVSLSLSGARVENANKIPPPSWIGERRKKKKRRPPRLPNNNAREKASPSQLHAERRRNPEEGGDERTHRGPKEATRAATAPKRTHARTHGPSFTSLGPETRRERKRSLSVALRPPTTPHRDPKDLEKLARTRRFDQVQELTRPCSPRPRRRGAFKPW